MGPKEFLSATLIQGQQEHHHIQIEDLKIVTAATTGQISHVEPKPVKECPRLVT